MLFFAARALAAMGARVEIAVGGENLVRSLSSEAEPSPGAEAKAGGAAPSVARDRAEPEPTALVQAEGLPNLLHELVHAVQAGRLDDDYGIDYGAIPFDLGDPAGRAILWNELACCVISCAYLCGPRRPVRADLAGSPGPEPPHEPRVEHWFREQVEIQPVFYGMDDDPPAFVARVGGLLHQHAAEAEAVLDRAYAATEQVLRRVGAHAELAAPAERLTLHALWSRLEARHSAAESA